MNYIISIDQSTSATKALLFDEQCKLVDRSSVDHKQYYPKAGWVEHDAMEIYNNTVEAIRRLVSDRINGSDTFSLAITNQRETVVVWNRHTGLPVYNAVVWQCMRGVDICNKLKADGYSDMVKAKSGLLIDPYFAGSGARWILDNVEGARLSAEKGDLCFGTIDSWLVFKLTEHRCHLTDFTNASRTMLFNIHTLDWDDDLLRMLDIPRSMMPKALPCDAEYGETTVEGLFPKPIKIAGVLGDSHGALVGQMCFDAGFGKATYGTGSSVMVNIGTSAAEAPQGLVTSVGFSALGKTFYAFEGNIHCTGATIQWLKNQLHLIDSASEIEAIATSVSDNGGVYLVPAFSGLGAPWWHDDVKGVICGLSLASTRAHVCRAALESIAYQVTDLIKTMTNSAGVRLKEIRVDGGPTKNKFLMQMQADLLQVPVVRSEVEDASAFGAVVMNRFAMGVWHSFEDAVAVWNSDSAMMPDAYTKEKEAAYNGWHDAVKQLLK
jgi:glycerol kinase